MTRPDQGLSSLAVGGKMRDPGNEVGVTQLCGCMGSDFHLRDLLKSHLSPALPHQKQTGVSAGQLDHNINERGKTLPKAWRKSLPKDLTANPEGGDPQVY